MHGACAGTTPPSRSPGQPISASSQGEIEGFLTFSHGEGLNSVEVGNLKQVHSDVTQGHGHGVVGSARKLWERWKRIARKIGDFQARALMTIFYFLILGPVAMVIRWRSDPLAIKPTTLRGWSDREEREGEHMAQARRQS
jgi:hypothetical protein